MFFDRIVRLRMFFSFVVTCLVALSFAMGAVMDQTTFGRTGVSQAREPMAVPIEYDFPVFGRRDLADASSQSGRAVTDFLQDDDPTFGRCPER